LSDLQQLITAVNYSTGTDADNAVQACSNAHKNNEEAFQQFAKTSMHGIARTTVLAHCTIHANAST